MSLLAAAPQVDQRAAKSWAWPAFTGGATGAAHSNNAGGAQVVLTGADAAIPSGQHVTIIIVVEADQPSLGPNISIGDPGSAAGEFNAYLPYSGDSKCYFRWGGSTDGVTSVSATISGSSPYWVLSSGPGGMQIWRGGQLIGSNTASPSRSALGGNLQIGSTGVARNWNCTLFAAIPQQFPLARNRELSENPWRILRQSRGVPWPAGAGGSALSGSNTDGTAASDLISASVILNASLTEGTTATELLTAGLIASATASEAAAAIDISSTGTQLVGTSTESSSAADVLATAASMVVQVLEAGGVVEQINAAQQLVVLLTESASCSDVDSAPETRSASIVDIAAALEILAAVMGGISAPSVMARLTDERRALSRSLFGVRARQASSGTRPRQ